MISSDITKVAVLCIAREAAASVSIHQLNYTRDWTLRAPSIVEESTTLQRPFQNLKFIRNTPELKLLIEIRKI